MKSCFRQAEFYYVRRNLELNEMIIMVTEKLSQVYFKPEVESNYKDLEILQAMIFKKQDEGARLLKEIHNYQL